MLDATPHQVLPSERPKQWLNEFTNRTGLWQGVWSMFTPRPVVGNYWFTADIQYDDGRSEEWSSPYWPTESGWTKFQSFRHVNFYNRLNLQRNRPAIPDFANYLLRSAANASDKGSQPAGSQPVALTLYANSYCLIYPEDGAILDPEELTWVTQSKQIAYVKGAP